MKTAKIQITLKEKQELNALLASNEWAKNHSEDDTIQTFTANFHDSSIEADIKICNGDGPYLDAVLFDGGSEVCVLDVGDEIEDEYVFDYDGEIYKVIIETI